uniref:Uncharacterized protein n=1 Tax=Ciona savignyi TaxID=51511 RepID=H2YP27_CIOSA
MKHSSSSRNDDQLDYPPPTKHSPQKVKTTTIFEKPPLPKQQLPTKLQKEMMLNKQKVPQDMPVVLQNELSNDLGGLDKISDDIARREDELRRHQHHLDECQARLLKQQAHQVKLLSTLDEYSVEATIGAKPNPQRSNFKQDYTPQPSSINFIKQSIPDVRPRPIYKRSSKPPVVQPPVPLQVDIVQHDLSTIQEAEIENSQIVSANQSLATLLNRSDASVTNPLSTISEELTRVEKQMSTVQESLDFMRNNFSKKI